jgi:hypothetical protein
MPSFIRIRTQSLLGSKATIVFILKLLLKKIILDILLDEWRNKAYKSAKLFKEKKLKFSMIRKFRRGNSK